MGSTKIQQPAPIQYSEQMKDTLMAQMEAQQGSGDFSEIGPMVALEAAYRPQWEALELQSMQNMLMGQPGGTRTVQDTRMVDTQSQVENPAWREAIDRGEIEWDGSKYVTSGRSRRTPTIEQYINKTTTTPEVYDREITTEATPGLLAMYQNQIAPAMSAMEAQYASDRAASEQALIEKYGAGITDKLREAAGNKELISQIIADASGETDPALLNQMVADAENAYGGQNVINQGPDILATAVRPGAEAGYVDQGQQSLQPAIDAGLLAAGQAELGAGDTEIDAALRARALERMGQGLTKAESRAAQQGQRQSWTARGLGTTLPSAAAEAFYLAERGEDRQRQNEQMARGVSAELEARRQGRLGRGAGLIGQSYGQRLGAYQTDIGRSTGQQQLDLQSQLANQQAGLTAQEANRQYGLNVAAQNEANRFAQQQANRGYQGNVLGLQQQIQGGRFGRQMGAAQLGQQTSADPFLALLGRPSQAMGQAQGMGAQGYGMAGAMGPRIFQPESQLASDLAMSNYQGQLAASTASGQNKSAVLSGLFQGLGSAFACHVAREVYGEENPKWVEFYVWKETKGPRWFKALYNEYSEQWAQFIKDKPTLKAFIKNWMDTKLGGK